MCNVKKQCPCDALIEQNVCPCAGEKPAAAGAMTPLTKTVQKAGCASKIGQGDLKRILGALPEVAHPNIMVGMAAGDDAGVWRLDERTALVQTVDVFTPCVDDAYLFGQIAAANSVSDVYAMGGRPITALSIACFPIDELDGAMMREMLRGGIDKLNEAGCCLIGGHSVNDPEPKLGFAVTGVIDPQRVVERGTARVGDVLVLTKPLGTGMVSFGGQLGRVSAAALEEAGKAMATLNKDAAELMGEHGAHACTDVTGFGLAGHLVELARTSGVSVELDLSGLPVFAAVEHCLAEEILSGAIEKNQEYAMAWIRNLDAEHKRNLPILYDPQTSGGLLVALPEERAEGYVRAMRERGHAAAAVIGRVVEKGAGAESEVRIVSAKLENFIGRKEEGVMAEEMKAAEAQGEGRAEDACCSGGSAAAQSCCEGGAATAGEGETHSDALAMFKDFMKAANEPGLIDKRNKKLMAIMLSIAVRCTPCLRIHLKSALAMGITKAEIDEAAGLAIAFGGCSALMFYKEICEELRIG